MEYREGKQRCLELGRRAKRPMQPLGLSLKWGVGLVERKGCRETRALRLHALRVRKNSINHEHHLCCYHRLFESHSDPLRWVGHGRASYHRPRNGAQRDERTCPSWLSQRKSAWDWKTGLTEHKAPHATAREARLVPTVQEERGGGRASGKTSGWCHLRKGRLLPPSLTRPLNLTAPHLLFGTLPPRESWNFPCLSDALKPNRLPVYRSSEAWCRSSMCFAVWQTYPLILF